MANQTDASAESKPSAPSAAADGAGAGSGAGGGGASAGAAPLSGAGGPPPSAAASGLGADANGAAAVARHSTRGTHRGRGRGRGRARGAHRGRGRPHAHAHAPYYNSAASHAHGQTREPGSPSSDVHSLNGAVDEGSVEGAGGAGSRVPLPKGIVAFVGAGNMARALIGGLLGRGMEPGKIRASARTMGTLDHLRTYLPPSSLYTSNVGVVSGADLVVLCVKPGAVEAVAREVATHIGRRAVVVSVAAGVTVARIVAALSTTSAAVSGAVPQVVRAMPNVAAAVRRGVTALAGNFGGRAQVPGDAWALFEASGKVLVVDERQLAAVTVVSGAGVAYCLMFAEALEDAGVRSGLPRDVAHSLVAATLEGAGALGTGQPKAHFAALRNGIESPGGVTVEATAALERGGLRATVHNAVDAAMLRIEQIEQLPKE